MSRSVVLVAPVGRNVGLVGNTVGSIEGFVDGIGLGFGEGA